MIETVYVARLDLPVGTDSWHPVRAEYLDGELYRLVEDLPEEHTWEFEKGDLVQCRLKVFTTGLTGLVAYARVDDRA